MKPLLALAGIAVIAAVLVSQPAPQERIGPQADGSFLLNSGWRLKPAGEQMPLDTFPMSTAMSPDGKYLFVLNGGYKPPSVSVVDTSTAKEISRKGVEDGWLGLTVSKDGKFVYVGGGSKGSVFELAFADGNLTDSRTFEIIPAAKRTWKDFVGDVAISPDGRLIYATGLYNDCIYVVNPQSGRLIETWPTGRRPYRILFHPDGQSFLVSSWADGAVIHHKTSNGEKLATIRVAPHPTDMIWRASKKEELEDESRSRWKARVFVAAANTNNVYSLGVSEAKDIEVLESINVAMTPRQPVGMTPTALALDKDQDRLFIVCSDANAVAVAGIEDVRSVVLGFVPTGWYPTAARVLPDGRLYVLNGRGQRSLPNRQGPNPTRRPAPVHEGTPAVEFVARIQLGSASVIPRFDDAQLEQYTKTVIANSPYRDELLDEARIPAGSVIPSRAGQASPIKHIIYIVKENRTYDQVLGDLGKGNGDPSLTLFNETVAPNHHKLAREFVLFDNFYVNADVSADGHNWSAAAIANDYVQKMWPNSYASRRRHYDYEGGEPANLPPAGYIWSNALQAGISIRNYGWWSTNGPRAELGQKQITTVRDPQLTRFTNLNYRAFDLDYPDVDRAKVFIEDLKQFEASGTMPQLIFLRIGNDHTSGTAAGKIAPLSSMADNDLAFGQIVEAVSKSKFWGETAIFVLEDDAQNGPDHVDSHRSPAFVISPYTRRGIVDSSMYNTTSMLRTIELILGIRPMTVFDASARPMFAAFAQQPDTRPYQAEANRHPLDQRNESNAAGAARSAKLDFSEADRIDDDELNEILWRAIRKTDPPAPVRSRFNSRDAEGRLRVIKAQDADDDE